MDHDTDWNLVWREMLERNLASKGCIRCSTFWDTELRAAEYLRASREEGAGRIEAMIECLGPKPDYNILDIGAGPGTLALPLAPRVKSITAIEPSHAMASVLRSEITRHEIANISLVEKHWEDTVVEDLSPPYDLVIAAYSLGISNLKAAILRMMAVCKGTIAIFFAAGMPFWEDMMIYLWPHLHGLEYSPGPKVDVIWNLLYQMGIYADIRITPLVQQTRYCSIEDAVNEYAPRMLIEREWQRDLVTQYFKNRLISCDDHYILKGTVLHTAIIWKNQMG